MSLSNYPTIRPSLVLDFQKAEVVDPRITFTRASTATRFNSYGVLETVANDIPRIDFNPTTLVSQGLLVEESRTNSIRNNTMVGAAAGTPGTLPTNWQTLGAGIGTLTQTIVGTGTSAGINYIDVRINGTTSTTSFGVGFETFTQIAAAVGQTWTSSVYLSRVGGTTTNLTVNLRVVDRDAAGGNLGNAVVDVTSTLGTTLSRFSLTRTLAGVGTAAVSNDVLFAFASGVAIDITLRIGLPQLEQGAFATSVIPTTTTALTRNADVASMTGTNFSSWFNASEGTLFAEASRQTSGAIAGVLAGFAQTATFNQSIYMSNDVGTGNSLAMNVISGVSQAGVGGTVSPAITSNFKAALAYATNNFAGSINGGTPVTDTSGTVPTPIGAFAVGSAPWGIGSTLWSGYIRRISYYPARLTNAQLQALTAT